MYGREDIIVKSHSSETFRKEAHKLVDFIANQLELSQAGKFQKTINLTTPEEQLRYWQDDFQSSKPTDLSGLLAKTFSCSINFHSKGYMGHQVSTPLPLTALTSAFIGYMNNSTTVYELGMAGNAMEKIVIEHLAEKFGYGKATGFVTSGGSLGNLTALLTARSSAEVSGKDYHRLAIMISEEAHYSVERAAKIMGIPNENIIKIPVDETFRIRTETLENIYQQANSEGKIIFCIVGCACTTATGAYDDLDAVASFAQQHKLWFHADGAHGGAVIFSEKYKHVLKGIERSDSLVLDFHKMMLVPSLSTAVIFNSRNRTAKAFSPQAAYLWQDQQAEEWYNSAKHTLECTKPVTILHTYAIMRLYGDRLYQQHIDTLYDLGKKFAEMIVEHKNMELAAVPSSNIVCFRYVSNKQNDDEKNRRILDLLLKEGIFYIVSTTLKGKFYLRVSLMNPLTNSNDLSELLKTILEISQKL